jgi:multidrug transporter EmrE-like cation transporter
MTEPSPAPGWYPDPSDPSRRIYWDGTAWSGPARADTSTSKKTAVAIGVCVLVVIGLVMSMQSVSLITGSGPVWTGVGVVAAGTAAAFFMRAATWVRVVAVLVLVVCVANGLYIENQLSQKRNEISRMFNH